jgi:hypothetical protein
MMDVMVRLCPAEVTLLEIAVYGKRDECRDRMDEMRKTKLERIRAGEWCLAYESEFTTFYEKEEARMKMWEDMREKISSEMRENRRNPFVSQ